MPSLQEKKFCKNKRCKSHLVISNLLLLFARLCGWTFVIEWIPCLPLDRPFRRYDPETGYKYWEAVTAFEPGMVYLDGTVSQLIHFTGWQGKSTLYFGDQIYADLADITLFYGWRTAAIIHELEVSFIHPLSTFFLLPLSTLLLSFLPFAFRFNLGLRFIHFTIHFT